MSPGSETSGRDTASIGVLTETGLLRIGEGCTISPHAIFDPTDIVGTTRPIVIADRVRIGHGAVLYGGTSLDKGAVVEEHAIVGKPECGYAIGHEYSGAGKETEIGAGAVIRAGAVVYAGCRLGANSSVGHHTTLRTDVSVGEDSQLAHRMTVERATRIGSLVRCSPGSHITSEVVMEDRVFIGAGVVTVNDKGMVWRQVDRVPKLLPPYFEHGAKVGSGSSVAAGVRVGREALIGTGSVVTRDIPPFAIAYGVPATVKGEVERSGHDS